MTHDPMTPLTPPSAREAAVVRVKSPWGPLAKLPMWARIAIIVVALVLVALLWQLVVVGAVVVLITAIVAVVKKTPTWLNFRNCQADDQACRQAVTHPISVADPPVVETRQESVTEAIPYGSSQQEDWNLDGGLTQVAVAGVAGSRTITYDVTYADGVETARVEVSNVVTAEPVHEVVSVGMYTPPAYRMTRSTLIARGEVATGRHSSTVLLVSSVAMSTGSTATKTATPARATRRLRLLDGDDRQFHAHGAVVADGAPAVHVITDDTDLDNRALAGRNVSRVGTVRKLEVVHHGSGVLKRDDQLVANRNLNHVRHIRHARNRHGHFGGLTRRFNGRAARRTPRQQN